MDSSCEYPIKKIAVIGNGIAAVTATSIFAAEGLNRDRIVIYGDNSDPFSSFAQRAQAIHQDCMRSESSGHFFPTDFPGLATIEALQTRSAVPVVRSLFDTYHPSLEAWLRHGRKIMQRLRIPVNVQRISAVHYDSGLRAFRIYNTSNAHVGNAQHVLLATGHHSLRYPEWLEPFKYHPTIRHAYEAKRYTQEKTVVIVGGAMAAAHEWIAALNAGANVIALTPHPLTYQTLNLPRCDFSAVGIRTYRQLSTKQKHQFLSTSLRGSIPLRQAWQKQIRTAESSGRFQLACSRNAPGVSVSKNKITITIANTAIEVDAIVAATGFNDTASSSPIITNLQKQTQLPMEQGRLLIRDDFTIPHIGTPESRIAVTGQLARWALPFADTVAGMKYIARRLVQTLNLPQSSFARIKTTIQLLQ